MCLFMQARARVPAIRAVAVWEGHEGVGDCVEVEVLYPVSHVVAAAE